MTFSNGRGIACRECGSPARGNPCWWSIKHPEDSSYGNHPPCCDYDYDVPVSAGRYRGAFAAKVAFGVLALLILFFVLAATNPN